MGKLIAEWDRQLAAQKVPREVMDSVRSYEGELKPDKTYGVFILCTPDGKGGGGAPYEAFVHVNHAHAKSTKPTLRLVWNRLAPKYEWVPDPVEEHSRIFARLIWEAARLARETFKSSEVKMYLYNRADRAFGRRFANALTGAPLPFTVAVRGNWLHLAMGK